ncbi:MAG: hypothetical protein IJ810_02245 [Candidatus Methanomethylophilus sp.]|nr:hypothetical protein [Methanomethylophilus sp.]
MPVSLKCPHCHGDVQLDESREFGFCMQCGTKIINEKEIRTPRKVTIFADPSLRESIQISIEGTQFGVTAEPGEFVELPSVGGKRKVLVTYKDVETPILLNMCILGAIQILPPAGIDSSGFVRYKNYTRPLPEL